MKKAYVVWVGRKPGVYDNWGDCKAQVDGFRNPKFKGFNSLDEANKEFKNYLELGRVNDSEGYPSLNQPTSKPVGTYLTVDAAFSGKKKRLEWRGVLVKDGKQEEVFRSGPYNYGSANVGEFLAIIEGFEYLIDNKLDIEIFSDSWNAQKWTLAKRHASKVHCSDELQKVLNEKSTSLSKGDFDKKINEKSLCDWNSKKWGEIPADFGRK